MKSVIAAGLVATFFLGEIVAVEVETHSVDFENEFPMPWFTGPLIASAGYVVKKGHYNIQPYFYYGVESSFYNSDWQKIPYMRLTSEIIEIPVKVGLGRGWQLELTPAESRNIRENQHSAGLADWSFGAAYQVLNANIKDPYPAVKLSLRLIAPIGKYQNLNPHKLRTDIHGFGSWIPTIAVNAAKLWRVYDGHYFECRAAATYFIMTPVSVHGFNVYGGADNTNAKVYSGNFYTLNLAGQYNLTQNWALAMDVLYIHKNKTTFKGFAGTFFGSELSLNAPSYENLSIAPALEYNFSSNVGLIAGVWFSLTGRNSAQFTTGVISLNIYH